VFVLCKSLLRFCARDFLTVAGFFLVNLSGEDGALWLLNPKPRLVGLKGDLGLDAYEGVPLNLFFA